MRMRVCRVGLVVLVLLALFACGGVAGRGGAGARRGTLRPSTGNGWPDCDSVRQASGYFDIPGGHGNDDGNNTTAASQKHYFYWAFEPRAADVSVMVLWLNGGPGCSSSIGLLTELGPCRFAENATVPSEPQRNPYAWNEFAALIFVDQPAGVGFSYADSPADADRNEHEVADDMYHFLRAMYAEYDALYDADLIIAGESYGGHYVPAIAERIRAANARMSRECHRRRDGKDDGVLVDDDGNECRPLPLVGIAIGNGLVDPYNQMSSYAELAYTYCAARLGSECVTASAYKRMRLYADACKAAIEECDGERHNASAPHPRLRVDDGTTVNWQSYPRPRARPPHEQQQRRRRVVNGAAVTRSAVSWPDMFRATAAPTTRAAAGVARRGCGGGGGDCGGSACADATLTCGLVFDTYGVTGRNPYDIRRMCGVNGTEACYDFAAVDEFLNRAAVKGALGVPGHLAWQQCNDSVYADFADDFFKDFSHVLPGLLQAGIRVMVYAGDVDFICNWLGNEAWAEQLAWDGRDAFARAPYTTVHDGPGGAAVGVARVVSSPTSPLHFSFVRVFDAGHMVPMDQPAAALAIMRAFAANRRFD